MKKKLEALKISFTADTIKKTPEMIFIRAFIYVHNKKCTSKYATNIKCLRTDWQPKTETILSSETDTQNLQLIKQQIEKKYLELVATNPNTTADELYLCLVGRVRFGDKHKKKQANKNIPKHKIRLVSEVLEIYHNSKLEMQATHTTKSYTSSRNFWLKYLKMNKLSNLELENISSDFLSVFYDQNIKKYKHNYLLIKAGFFRTAFSHAIDKQLIAHIHFEKLNKGSLEPTRTEEYLTFEQYEKLKNAIFVEISNSKIKITKLQAQKLEKARDVYAFMCETGFSYIDYFTFDYTLHIKKYKDMQVFYKKRHKLRRIKNEKTVSQRGLFSEVAINILAKYDNKLPAIKYRSLLNYLKTIAKLLDLPAFLSHTHSGRHSSGMLLLNDGLDIQDVQAFMGHKNLATTQSTYAIAETEKIAEAMRKIKK
jgi:integrase